MYNEMLTTPLWSETKAGSSEHGFFTYLRYLIFLKDRQPSPFTIVLNFFTLVNKIKPGINMNSRLYFALKKPCHWLKSKKNSIWNWTD